MSEFNMNNQYDQKSDTTAYYIGRVFAEYTVLRIEAEEMVKKNFCELCDSVMAAMPDWVEPVLSEMSDFFDFALNNSSNIQRIPCVMLLAIPIITSPMEGRLALAGGGTTGFSTGGAIMFAGLLAANSGGGSGGGNNEKETFSDRRSVGGKKSPKNENVPSKAGDKTPRGREYTNHGAARANERNFDSDKIDNIIDNNKKSRTKEIDPATGDTTWRYQDSRGNTVITDEWSNRVVTVYSHPESLNNKKYIPKTFKTQK